MIKLIPKGCHSCWSIPRLLFGKTITRTVTFFPSCKYDLGNTDQLDWNKLFGIGFFPGKHTLSYRFGWRWNDNTNRIEIAAYWYENGVRKSQGFASIKVMERVEYRIRRSGPFINFELSTGPGFSTPGKWQPFGWKLGLFFGGNRPAPHDIKIEIL